MDKTETVTQRCILCQTPVRPKTAAGKNKEFCCTGCEKVFDVLSRLDDGAKAAYVETARKLGLIPADRQPTLYQAVGDRESPAPAPAVASATATRTEKLSVDGLVCPSCGWVAKEVLLAHNGVAEAEVNYFTGMAEVTYDMTQTSVDDLDDLLRPLGYGLAPLSEEHGVAASRKTTFDFVVVAILTMNVMSLSVLRYFHSLGHLSELPGYLAYIEGVLVLPILAIGWVPTARRAGAALARGRMTMDLLIAIGVAAAALLSYVSLVSGMHDMFFETCAGLVTISLLSRMIESRLRDRAFAELGTLMRMPVVHVRRLGEAGAETFAKVADVCPGQVVLCFEEELVPFDGRVEGDAVIVSEAVLTGEPAPVVKHPGDPVTAGSRVAEGTLTLRVERRFEDTVLSQITRSIGETLARQEGHLRQADRIASWFIPAVILVAAGAWIGRLILFGPAVAFSPGGWFPSVAVLAVACPCAFSLAGISAVTAATGDLLRQGFLVKALEGLENLSKMDHAVFDKTGTLTRGEMSVAGLYWRTHPIPEMLGQVLDAEHRSLHPAAAAIRAFLGEHGIREGMAPDEIEDIHGLGRRARFGDETLTIGAAPLFEAPFIPAELTPAHSAVWFGRGNRASGLFLMADRVRDEAPAIVAALRRLGFTVSLLSGDGQAATETVAGLVGIDEAKGDATIDDKIASVSEMRRAGKQVVFIGDGTNDALAMQAAHVSVALAKSTDEALAASDIVALKGTLAGLPALFAMGRRLSRVVTQNYIWAFAFNTLFIPVAAAGRLVPLAAMLLMLVSSTAVLLNAARLRSRAPGHARENGRPSFL